MSDVNRVWYKALELDELPEGRVKPVTRGLATVCMTHYQGQYAALDNECPPKRTARRGLDRERFLRCPWHGWDYHPLTGKPPGGYDDGVQTHTVESRDDGIYVAFDVAASPLGVARTISDVMVETMVNWGVRSVFGMVGHSNLGLAEALRHQHEAVLLARSLWRMASERSTRSFADSHYRPAGHGNSSLILGHE